VTGLITNSQGQLIDPNTGGIVDPETGIIQDPQTGYSMGMAYQYVNSLCTVPKQ
jgi:hypothetical protein